MKIQDKVINLGDVVESTGNGFSDGNDDWEIGTVVGFLGDGQYKVFFPRRGIHDTMDIRDINVRLSWNKSMDIVRDVRQRLQHGHEGFPV